MIESNDFNIKEFTSVNYGNCSVNIDIQSRNYMIVSVEKVEV